MRVTCDIDKQIAKDAIDQPGRSIVPILLAQNRAGQIEFVNRIGSCFVDARRLAGWADENSGKQVRKRWVVQPTADQALEKMGPSKEWTVRRRRPSQYNEMAASCPGTAAVQHKVFRPHAAAARFFVEHRCVLHQLPPASGG